MVNCRQNLRHDLRERSKRNLSPFGFFVFYITKDTIYTIYLQYHYQSIGNKLGRDRQNVNAMLDHDHGCFLSSFITCNTAIESALLTPVEIRSQWVEKESKDNMTSQIQ